MNADMVLDTVASVFENNLKAELLVFVPSDASCEINCLKLKNNSETEKKYFSVLIRGILPLECSG